MMDDLVTIVAKYCELKTLLNLRMVNREIKSAVDKVHLDHPSLKFNYPMSLFMNLSRYIHQGVHETAYSPIIKVCDLKSFFLSFGVGETAADQYLYSLHSDNQVQPIYLRKNLVFFHAEKLRHGEDPIKLGKIAYMTVLVNQAELHCAKNKLIN